MEQLTLFDDERISRKKDPQTSKQAAREMHTKLPKTQQALFAVFSRSVSALTANEAAEIAVKGLTDVRANVETFRKRTHELVRKGLIRECGTRCCLITGKNVAQYRACDET